MYTDVDKLEKILFNLLSNAFKYTPDEKSISLSVTCEKQILCLQVKDEGRGINAQKLNRLFTRFDTLDEIDPNMSTGIGLSLVKELLNLLHGTVRVDSKLGEGSSFFIRLPGNRDVFDADANIEFILADSKNSGQEVAIPDKLTEEEEDKETRILIIEDNEELRHFICGVLAREYVVLEAGNGCQGLEMTLRELPDIVISDIMMPEMGGDELCVTIKGDIETSHIPILLLTALGDERNILEGLKVGADDYITKPFNLKILRARIANLLANRALLREKYGSLNMAAEILEEPVGKNCLNALDWKFISGVRKNVEDNLDDPDFTVDLLCSLQNMSRSSFYNKLKALTGQAPADYIRLIRLNRAAELLKEGGKSVSEVAEMTGFCDGKYFREVFKKHFKVSPSRYGKEEPLRVDAE